MSAHAGETFNNCAILDDYKIGELIGEGGFGKVHLGINKENKKQVAIKFMDMTQTCKLLAHFSIYLLCLWLTRD